MSSSQLPKRKKVPSRKGVPLGSGTAFEPEQALRDLAWMGRQLLNPGRALRRSAAAEHAAALHAAGAAGAAACKCGWGGAAEV